MSNVLLSYVIEEVSLIKEFTGLLNQEEQAFLKGDFSVLPNLAENKMIAINKIAKVSLERIKKQVMLGFEEGKTGADKVAEEAGIGSIYQDKWFELITLSIMALNYNIRNEILINTI
jgi:flagellar biosynthesis/type III secretory pathway chaperone